MMIYHVVRRLWKAIKKDVAKTYEYPNQNTMYL